MAAIEEWGLDRTLKKAKGMFAIALWSKIDKSLSLACDRIGEKPIYYGWVSDQFVFASELKAIKKFPEFNNSIDQSSLALFLRLNSIPAPYSIYEDIYKLEPGQIIRLEAGSKKIEKQKFWSIEKVYEKGNMNKFSFSSSEAVNKLESILSNAVSSQMQSDVPLGAFLSGGIDSSTVVALMQSFSNNKVNTFTIGFNAKEFDEAKHAKMVAKHLGTNHFEKYVTEGDALDVIQIYLIFMMNLLPILHKYQHIWFQSLLKKKLLLHFQEMQVMSSSVDIIVMFMLEKCLIRLLKLLFS